ncbi:TPA: sensor histidine kinase [Stenotrophomonas maltophilia]|nr:sensor histidine kinase [Stenotrophomonas maltophilia]
MAKLKPRARIIRTIGDQLISGPEAALIELVKNSYDADARTVRITITPPRGTLSAEISVTDNGHGMTEEDILSRWFEPATNEKAKRKISPGGRIMLGAKGIGRFAAARLGDSTRLSSWTSSNGKCLVSNVDIDWGKFTADAYLDSIDIDIETTESSIQRSGVEISIERLRDAWTKPRMERLIRELRRVASPTEVSQEFSMHLDITQFTTGNCGFDGTSLLEDNNRDYLTDSNKREDPTEIIPFPISEHSDYSLKGSFDLDGSFIGIFSNHRGDGAEVDLVVPAPRSSSDVSCGPVEVAINVYDREHDAIESLFTRAGLEFKSIGIRLARQILTDNSGISIFRDGFRIRPYGEPENDWLELERQRVQNPSKKLGLSQLSGRVYIASEANSGLVERSSREGLEHGDSFDRLKELIQGVITHIEERRIEFRERAGLSRKAQGDVGRTRALAKLTRTRREIERTPEPYATGLKNAIEKDSADLYESLEEIETYQRLLQSRAALGLVLSQVIHEARRLLNPMATAAKSLIEDTEHLLSDSKHGEMARRHLPDNSRTLSEGVRGLSNLIKRLDPLSGRRRGKPTRFNAGEIIATSLALMREELLARSVTLDYVPVNNLWASGYKEDLQSAILNVLENAAHWASMGSSLKPSVWLEASLEQGSLVVSITNNGPPIDPSYSHRLFDAGFSLKSGGTGLGLAIAREACRASKGELTLDDSSDVTKFSIRFPT